MRKHLILSTLVSLFVVSALPATASAYDGWHRGWDDGDEWYEHHWHDHEGWRWRHGYHIRDVEPVYEAPGYYYYPQPVYVAPPPPRVVYYEPQPVFSFFFGR